MLAGAFVALAPGAGAAAPSPVQLSLTANPGSLPEPGGVSTFTLTIQNNTTGGAQITQLTSNHAGSLAGKGTCAASVVVPALSSVSCAYPAALSGNAGAAITETVTGFAAPIAIETQAADQAQTDNRLAVSASVPVAITDVLPRWTMSKDDRGQTVPEIEGLVTYYVTARNFGPEPLTVIHVQDVIVTAGNRPIDITHEGDVVYQTTCTDLVGAVLAANGGLYECEFTIPFRGNAGDVKIDDLSITVMDDEKNTDTRLDSEFTEMTDVLPTITVDKSDGGATLPAAGGRVDYTLKVTNTSVEPVMIKSVSDSLAGTNLDITKVGGAVVATTCGSLVNSSLAVGASVSCTFSLNVTGAPGTSVRDTVSVTAADDEGNRVTASDSEDTPIGPAPPTTAPPTTIVSAPPTTIVSSPPAVEPAPSVQVEAAVAAGQQLAFSGSDSALRAALATMLLGAGMALLGLEMIARKRVVILQSSAS